VLFAQGISASIAPGRRKRRINPADLHVRSGHTHPENKNSAKILDLVVVFLLRTIITLPIVAAIAHWVVF
jgi:hypothetical protein